MRSFFSKRIGIIILTIIILAATLVVLSSCIQSGDSDDVDKDLKVELYSVDQSTDLAVDNEKKTVTFSVSVTSEKFSLSGISFRNNSEIVFKAYSDKELTKEIEKEITLSEGENVFYIQAWHKDAPSEKVTYTVTVTKPVAHVHSFGGWTVVTEATCTKNGLQERVCECGEKETEVIEAKGHTFVGGICEICGTKLNYTEGLSYELNKEGTGYTVTGIGTATDTDIVIPSEYNGLPVTGIGNEAFNSCYSLTSITILDSVTNIGRSAFYWCTSLTSVTIGNGVTSIGDSAFSDCTSLTSITIGNGVTSIGDRAFYRCDPLTSIVIPDSVTSIGEDAFYWCDSLNTIYYNGDIESWLNKDWHSSIMSRGRTLYINNVKTEGELTIPDGVTTIPSYAFAYQNLTSVTIPDSVTSIGEDAFRYCTSLTSITVDENNTAFASIDGNLYNKDKTTLIQYAIGKTSTEFTIPDSVTSIGDDAFRYCDSLTSIVIPDSVTSIGSSAFALCDSLTSIVIPDSVTSIGDEAFYWCDSLTSIVIPDSVSSIGDLAFDFCTSLTSVTIGNSVTSIGDRAFSDCDSLTSIVIPVGVTSIGDSAFSDCTSLTSVTIGNSVTNIGDMAFISCTSLTSIVIPDSVESIGVGAFESCDSLTSVTIGNSVTSIGSYAFRSCDSLTSVTIGNGVTSIGEQTFSDCTSLTSITVDKNNTAYASIGGNLYNKDKTTLIQYAIGKTATEFTIPDSVTSIGDEAFVSCDSLTSIDIPDSVSSIGDGAFDYCTSLTDVYYGGTEEQWNDISIGIGNEDLTSANIHFSAAEGTQAA